MNTDSKEKRRLGRHRWAGAGIYLQRAFVPARRRWERHYYRQLPERPTSCRWTKHVVLDGDGYELKDAQGLVLFGYQVLLGYACKVTVNRFAADGSKVVIRHGIRDPGAAGAECASMENMGARPGMLVVETIAKIRQAFVSLWIEHKGLPLSVGNRRVMADALRVLMLGNYRGPAITLYRGASAGERRRRGYGFSWTTRLDVARDKFAEARRSWTGGAVVLETLAPAEAVLLVREEEGYYDEAEVVVDPFKLGRVRVIDRLEADTGRPPA